IDVPQAAGQRLNIATGSATTINELVEVVGRATGVDLDVRHGEPRAGDVAHSVADITAARRVLGYAPTTELADGIRQTARSGADARRLAADAATRARARVRPRRRALAVQHPGAALAVAAAPARGDGLEPGAILARDPAHVPASRAPARRPAPQAHARRPRERGPGRLPVALQPRDGHGRLRGWAARRDPAHPAHDRSAAAGTGLVRRG